MLIIEIVLNTFKYTVPADGPAVRQVTVRQKLYLNKFKTNALVQDADLLSDQLIQPCLSMFYRILFGYKKFK